ncbi:MAG: hypothetical protein BWX70_00141 [Verrucomicrobia bacterium ADurb.Bin070]|nr:MAG: hypothetical protein BWX70_00141 [Verrucomicrobia bacterium ADurb.Bin070]
MRMDANGLSGISLSGISLAESTFLGEDNSLFLVRIFASRK